MNHLNRSLFILRLINRNNLLFSTTSCNFIDQPSSKVLFKNQKAKSSKSDSLRWNKSNDDKPAKYNKRPSYKSDAQMTDIIFSNKNDPNCFGTLSENWKTQEELSKLPDEDDDKVVTEFLFNREGKTRLTTNQYGKIIKKFLDNKKIGHAIEVLETRMLKDDRVKPETYIFNLLIGACGRVGYTKKAFNLYKQMRDRAVKVTGRTYTGLFNACANSPFPEDGLQRARHLRAVLVERQFLMNQIIYHSMIKAFGRCGDLETAFLLVDEMLEKKINVTEETFNFLLQACITDKTCGFRHALLVWRKMMEKRVRPNLFSFNLLLRCSRDCGLGDKTSTHQVIQVLLYSGQEMNREKKILIGSSENDGTGSELTTTNPSRSVPNLISLHPSMGDVMVVNNITSPEHRLMLMGGCRGFLQQMEFHKVRPDIKTVTQLLDQIPSTFAAEIELLQKIREAKITPDVDFYNMLLRKRCLRGDYNNAKEVLKLIQKDNLRPDMMTFGVLAMTCQCLSSARQLLHDIDNLGYRPNIEILGTLLKNACFSRKCDFIIDIMKIIENEELKPNDQLFSHLDNFYRFATDVLRKQTTDDTGRLSAEQFTEYCDFYRVWRRKMRPEDPPHPWEQFKNITFEPEDIELINHGKVKYANT